MVLVWLNTSVSLGKYLDKNQCLSLLRVQYVNFPVIRTVLNINHIGQMLHLFLTPENRVLGGRKVIEQSFGSKLAAFSSTTFLVNLHLQATLVTF